MEVENEKWLQIRELLSLQLDHLEDIHSHSRLLYKPNKHTNTLSELFLRIPKLPSAIMVSFTKFVAIVVATAAPIIATPAPLTKIVTTLQFTVAGYYGNGGVTAEGIYSESGAAGSFTVQRDPANSNNVLITSTVGPCGVVATVFECSAKTKASSFPFASWGFGLDLSLGGILSFDGKGFSVSNTGSIINVPDYVDEENFVVYEI